jgi:hypothetical protein
MYVFIILARNDLGRLSTGFSVFQSCFLLFPLLFFWLESSFKSANILYVYKYQDLLTIEKFPTFSFWQAAADRSSTVKVPNMQTVAGGSKSGSYLKTSLNEAVEADDWCTQ